MIEPYGKPRYVREREIFYDEVPPDAGPGADDDDDHDLGCDRSGIAGTHEGEEE